MMHASASVRAYLKAAGLPEFDAEKWKEARKILLGDRASDPTNVLSLQASSDEAQRIAEANAEKLLRA